jgi:hypothetical protein
MEVFNWYSGGWSPIGSTRHIGHKYVYCARWLWCWRNWWNDDWQGKLQYSEKTCPSAAWSATKPTCCPDENSYCRGGKPATNRLSDGTANLLNGVSEALLACSVLKGEASLRIMSNSFFTSVGYQPIANPFFLKCLFSFSFRYTGFLLRLTSPAWPLRNPGMRSLPGATHRTVGPGPPIRQGRHSL